MERIKVMLRIISFIVLFASVAPVQCGTPPEDLKRQEEFKKAYSSPHRLDHVSALDLLDGSTHMSTWQMLSTVVSVDPFVEARTAAFKKLSLMPATDPGLSTVLVHHFQALKPTDIEQRIAYAELMGNSEFNYSIVEALSEYGGKMRYPEFITMDGYRDNNSGRPGMNGTIGGDPNVYIGKQRADFEKYVKVFNGVTKAGIAISDRNSPAGLKAWWGENKNRIYILDKTLLDKYKKEEIERLNKNSTLAQGKDGDKADKPTAPVKKGPSKSDE